ncbi:hypothetical protein P171DRAFT_492132 [Karstenula rhodostoma CBS 690.94]|uniref:DUF7730 domain-containing protein n=1 Tax=Karstenula rhodostoma CBS 690.94 TaxID=1392251 RepID=A0A9P4P6C3_9PLEO|nr:hypothetical protein P171DRAFT_492132 [Karstenula rhodostoma CBS 690.94]
MDEPDSTKGIVARKFPAVRLLQNGLLDLSETPDHLVATVKRNAIESPLLRLPAEIRNRIFQYALGGYTINVRRFKGLCILVNCDCRRYVGLKASRDSYDCDGSRTRSTSMPFRLREVCRQAYSETATLGFQLSKFTFDHSLWTHIGALMQSWLSHCPPWQTEVIGNIRLPASMYIRFLASKLQQGDSSLAFGPVFPTLRKLHLSGGYDVEDFAEGYWCHLTGRDVEYSISECNEYYAGWTAEQFIDIIQEQAKIEVGTDVEVIVERAPRHMVPSYIAYIESFNEQSSDEDDVE